MKRSVFRSESALTQLGMKLNQLIGLNLLVMVVSLPIITAGAAQTAMHEYLFKLHKDEEGAMAGPFFSSFKKNFSKATLVWLPFLLMFAVIAADILIMNRMNMPVPLLFRGLFFFLALVVYGASLLAFPLVARLNASVRDYLKDAFLMEGILGFRIIPVILMYMVPWILLLVFPAAGWISFLLGISGPGYLATCLYDRHFDAVAARFEAREEVPQNTEYQENPKESLSEERQQ